MWQGTVAGPLIPLYTVWIHRIMPQPAGGAGRVGFAWKYRVVGVRKVVEEVVMITPRLPFSLVCPTACFHSDTVWS